MPVAVMSSKGQLVVPKTLRKIMHLHPGDKVDFAIDEEGVVTLHPITDEVSSLSGALSRYAKKRKVTVEEMNAAIRNRKRT